MWFFLALFFALWTSLSMPIAKKILRDIHPATFLVLTNLFTIPFMFVFILFLGGIPEVTPQFYGYMSIAALLDAGAFLAVFWAIKSSPISLIAPIASYGPLSTLIFALFTLQEIPTGLKVVGIIVIVLGSYFLELPAIKSGLLMPFRKLFSDTGVKLYLLTTLLWGITPIFQKKAILETAPQMPLYASFIGFVFVTLIMFPFVIRRNEKKLLSKIKIYKWWFILLGICTVLAQLAAYTAFAQTNVSYVAAVMRLASLFTIVWGTCFFQEKNVKGKLIGASIMILGTILLLL